MKNQCCDVCGCTDMDDSHSFRCRLVCNECANRSIEALDAVARWWADGGCSLSPDAILGDSDQTIKQMVEQATGIYR